MVDTAFWTPADKAHRLPAAYRHTESGLTETEPAGGGFYAGEPPFDVSHAELVSTAADYFDSCGCWSRRRRAERPGARRADAAGGTRGSDDPRPDPRGREDP